MSSNAVSKRSGRELGSSMKAPLLEEGRGKEQGGLSEGPYDQGQAPCDSHHLCTRMTPRQVLHSATNPDLCILAGKNFSNGTGT